MRAPEPYTPQIVREIRSRADKGQSESSLATWLGWTLQRLRNVARKHEIQLRAELGPARPVNVWPINRDAAPPPVSKPRSRLVADQPAVPDLIPQTRVRRKAKDANAAPYCFALNGTVTSAMMTEIRLFANQSMMTQANATRSILRAGLDVMAAKAKRAKP